MLIPSLTSPRPKLIPVPAIWAPKSNLGLILKERSFMDRGPMLMFTTVDFFLVLVGHQHQLALMTLLKFQQVCW
jgi:hypothetical protein